MDEFVDCLDEGVMGEVIMGDSALLDDPWLFTLRFCCTCCGLD